MPAISISSARPILKILFIRWYGIWVTILRIALVTVLFDTTRNARVFYLKVARFRSACRG